MKCSPLKVTAEALTTGGAGRNGWCVEGLRAGYVWDACVSCVGGGMVLCGVCFGWRMEGVVGGCVGCEGGEGCVRGVRGM